MILKVLLNVRKILETNEFKRHLNRLYLDDYCVWIQTSPSKLVRSLADQLQTLVVSKESIDLPLLALEHLALHPEELEEEEDEEEDQDEENQEEDRRNNPLDRPVSLVSIVDDQDQDQDQDQM